MDFHLTVRPPKFKFHRRLPPLLEWTGSLTITVIMSGFDKPLPHAARDTERGVKLFPRTMQSLFERQTFVWLTARLVIDFHVFNRSSRVLTGAGLPR